MSVTLASRSKSTAGPRDLALRIGRCISFIVHG